MLHVLYRSFHVDFRKIWLLDLRNELIHLFVQVRSDLMVAKVDTIYEAEGFVAPEAFAMFRLTETSSLFTTGIDA